MVIANTSAPSSDAQRAAEATGRDLGVAIAGECKRLNATHADMLSKAMAKPALAIDEGTMGMELGIVAALPPVPHAIFQTLIDGTQWTSDVIDNQAALDRIVKRAVRCGYAYRVILLHVESGNERADRERREKQEDMDRHRDYVTSEHEDNDE